MSNDADDLAEDPEWGEPPHPDVIARLLAERYPIRAGERLTVDVEPANRAMSLRLFDARNRWEIRVRYEGGGPAEDRWLQVADALDALFGTLIENGRVHRSLPVGSGVIFQGTSFLVEVQHDLPEISKLAEQLLDESSS